jgi:TRAP-type C4-dicarboxylate transport system substrate-binding protein
MIFETLLRLLVAIFLDRLGVDADLFKKTALRSESENSPDDRAEIGEMIMNISFRSGLLAGGLVLGLASGLAAQTTIRLETYAGPKHPMNAVALADWAAAVEKASDGRLVVDISYPPIDPRDLYDRVRTGIADVAWMTHGYTTGRFVLTDMVELPGNGGNAEAASAAYWRVYTGMLADKGEHVGVTPLALFVHGPGMLHTRIPIETYDDLQGMKIRTGGGTQGKIAERLGFTTVSAPATKAQEILSQGVADGIFFSIETINSFKLGDVVKYHYALPGNLYTSSMAIIMNTAMLEGLSEEDRTALMSVSGEVFSSNIGKTWDDADTRAIEALSAAGNQIGEFPPAVTAEIQKRLADLDGEWIARAEAEGVANAAEVLAAYRAEIAAAN